MQGNDPIHGKRNQERGITGVDMKTLIYAVVTMMVMLLFTGGNRRLSTSGEAMVSDTLFSSANKVDTIKVKREKGVAAMSYFMYTIDSSNVKSVVLRRVVNSVAEAAQVGDTLIALDSSATAKLRIKTVTLAPLADEYWFVVTYSAKIDSPTTINNSLDSNHVRHGVIRQYNWQ